MAKRHLSTSAWLAVGLLLSGFALAPAVHADGNALRGEAHFTICRVCHGDNAQGHLQTGAPRLAGLQDWYLASQLRKFRAGLRGGHLKDVNGLQMSLIAKQLPTGAGEDVIAYITTLDAPPSTRTETSGDPARGQELYAACIQCHGSKGQGLKASNDNLATYNLDSPRLGGQHDWYLIRQLRNFQNGIRGYHPDDKEGREMRGRIRPLYKDQHILDVVAYIKTLP